MMMFGDNAWKFPSNMARTGHIYDWDANQNVVFPRKLTATNLAGALANSFNFNGKTFDNTAPVNFGTIGIAYGGTAASTRKDALTNLLGQEETTNLNEALDQGKYQWSDNATNYPAGEQYGTLLNLTHYESSNTTYNYFTQIAIGTHGTIHWRDKINAANFSEWRKILDSANYTDYVATKDHTHTNLSINGKTYDGSTAVDVGTIDISYGGTGKTTRKEALTALLGQPMTTDLDEALEQGTYYWGNSTGIDSAPTTYGTLISLLNSGDTHNNESNWLTHIAIGTNNTIYWRQKINRAVFTVWKTILDSNNYSTYAATKNHNHDDVYLKSVPIASSTTLGGVKISSGLAVAADGTISVASAPKLTTGRNITIGSKTLAFDGSAALTYSLADIGAASTSSLNNYMPLSGGMFTGGVQFNSINYPVSWTAGSSSDIIVTLAPKASTATASQHLYLPLKTGTLATCSKSAILLVEASTWSEDGQATLTLPESYDGVSHTVVISPNPDIIVDADTYAAYAAAQIVPSFSSGTSLVLHAYGTVPTVNIQIIITQID